MIILLLFVPEPKVQTDTKPHNLEESRDRGRREKGNYPSLRERIYPVIYECEPTMISLSSPL